MYSSARTAEETMANVRRRKGNTVRSIRREFFQKRALGEQSLAEILSRRFSQQKRFFSELSYAARPLVGNRCPRTWEDLRAPKSNPYLRDANLALRWALVKLSLFAETIARAVLDQNTIERKLLLGQYEAARAGLEVHIQQFGVSIWSLDIHFVLREQVDGFSGNRYALAEFFRSVENNWARMFAYNCSYRSQNNVSTREYTSTFRSLIDGYRAIGISSYATTYLQYRYLDILPESDEAICDVLHFEARNPLLDQYATMLRLVASRASKTMENQEIEAVHSLADEVQDPYLSSLASITSRKIFSGLEDTFDQLRQCSDFYLQSDFRRAKQLALPLLAVSAIDFVHYDVVASASARLGENCPQVFREHSIAQTLLKTLFDWYSAGRPRRQSLESLQRLARALHSTRLGPALHAFVNTIDEYLPPLGHECIGFLASPCPLPHTALTYADTRLGQEYVDNFRASFGESPGTKLIAEYLRLCWEPGSEPAFHNLSENARLRYRGAALLSARQYAPAVQMFARLRCTDSDFVKLNPELYAGEAFALFELGEFERAASLMSDLYCRDPGSIPPALLRRFGGLLGMKSFVPDRGNVSWSILAAATLREEGRTINTDRVHDFVGDYIESNGATRPTELLSRLPELPKDVLVFLMDCCTPDVLESSIWYESQEAVLRERLALCAKLHEDHKLDKDELSSEIAELTRRLAIMDITNRIERSRIYVDTSKIIELVDEKTLDQTVRLLMLLALKDKDLRRGIKVVMLPSAEGGRMIILNVDESLSVFEDSFETLKKQFLYSPEFGLDANLSQRIRHGTLAGELRSMFDRFQLTTKKDSTGSYQRNRHWIAQLEVWDAALAEAVDRGFRAFSKNLDDMIQLVRERWIQIRVEANPNGLFDYNFSTAELEKALETVSPLAEPEDVYEVIVQALWKRTEACLERVREAITGALYSKLTGYIDELQAAIEGLATQSHSANSASLRGAITQCKTDLARELPKIANWFRIESHEEHKNFQLRDLVQGVEQGLNKISTFSQVELDSESEIGNALPGSCFRSLWDVLLILLDNAAKHSGKPMAEVRLKAVFTPDVSRLTCTNSMAVTHRTDLLREKVADLNRLSLKNEKDLSKLRQEGGSGIAKLHKIVRHDMGRAEGYRIEFDVTSGGDFQVHIDFNGGLLHENPTG
jgi:hypothetical protein